MTNTTRDPCSNGHGFSEMAAYLKRTPACRVILVEKTDRLYRNLKDYVTLDELDLEVHFVKENVVLSKESRSSEKFMHGIKVLMAKNYIDNLSEETRRGRRRKRRRVSGPPSLRLATEMSKGLPANAEKRRLLDFLCSNSRWTEDGLRVELRQPFDIIATAAEVHGREKAAGVASNGLAANWLLVADAIRTLVADADWWTGGRRATLQELALAGPVPAP